MEGAGPCVVNVCLRRAKGDVGVGAVKLYLEPWRHRERRYRRVRHGCSGERGECLLEDLPGSKVTFMMAPLRRNEARVLPISWRLDRNIFFFPISYPDCLQCRIALSRESLRVLVSSSLLVVFVVVGDVHLSGPRRGAI